MLLEAQDWRNRDVLPQFANGKAVAKDQLNLTHVKTFEHLYTRKDLPNLRIIRVRTIGTGETPQYFAVREDNEDEVKEENDLKQLTGFIDTQVASEFFHYLSVGSMPTTAAKEQQGKTGFYKTDEGGGIAFKHQTIVEFVPFFLRRLVRPMRIDVLSLSLVLECNLICATSTGSLTQPAQLKKAFQQPEESHRAWPSALPLSSTESLLGWLCHPLLFGWRVGHRSVPFPP